MSIKEKDFQSALIKELKERFDGCIVLKTDGNYIQGIPDLLILHNNKWAALECKKEKKSSVRPNQKYYVEEMDRMSFSRFIYPENKEEVLDDLQRAFGSKG
jgi:DNA polymerase III epsilon subunit-like protein